jgi:hypothetical protein
MQQTQKQPEDYVQGLIALETEIKDKLSLLGLEVLRLPAVADCEANSKNLQ